MREKESLGPDAEEGICKPGLTTFPLSWAYCPLFLSFFPDSKNGVPWPIPRSPHQTLLCSALLVDVRARRASPGR